MTRAKYERLGRAVVAAVKLAEAVEDIREEREAYEVDKADAKRKGEWDDFKAQPCGAHESGKHGGKRPDAMRIAQGVSRMWV